MSNLLDLSAKISLDTSSYDKGLSNSSSKMSGFGDKLKSGLQTAVKVGGAALATLASSAVAVATAFTKMTFATSEHADEIDKQSQKLGLSRQAYQEWDYVLSQAGVEITAMSTGLKTMTNQIQEAKNGSADATERFAALGISLEDLQTMSREDIFKATIKGFQNMSDSTDRAALANKLFGKSGQELTALFNETADSTDELIEKAHEYGMVMSDEAVQAGVDMQDSLDTLQKTFDGVKNNLASEFIPAFTEVINGMTDLIAGKEGASEKISQGLEDITSKILEKTPELIDMVIPIIEGAATAIIDNAPQILDAGENLIEDVLDAIPGLMGKITDFLNTDSLPKLIDDLVTKLTSEEFINDIIDAGVDLLGALLNNIEGIIAAIGPKIGPFISSLVNKVLEKLPEIVKMGVDLLCHLVDDVDSIIDGLIDGLWGIIDGIFNFLTDPNAQAMLLLAGMKLGIKLTAGILKSLTMLNVLEKIPGIGDLFKGLSDMLDNATNAAIAPIDDAMEKLKAQIEASQTTGAGFRSGTGNAGYDVTININGDVKAGDVADEVSNRLRGTMVSRGIA